MIQGEASTHRGIGYFGSRALDWPDSWKDGLGFWA